MKIDGIGGQLNAPQIGGTKAEGVGGSSFGDTMKKAITDVNDLQTSADQMATKLASGDAVEIHQAMIAMQKASTALQFTLAIRNKIIDAYHEVMRTSV